MTFLHTHNNNKNRHQLKEQKAFMTSILLKIIHQTTSEEKSLLSKPVNQLMFYVLTGCLF